MPGFVDPHTHAIWAGDRAAEFEMRLQGKTYLEILAAGGGILSTVRATRTASLETLLGRNPPPPVEHVHLRHNHRRGENRLWAAHGHRAAHAAGFAGSRSRRPAGARLTFLGAHAIAPEYKDDPDEYTALLCGTMLPVLKEWWPHHAPNYAMPFVDVFCETGAFTLAQSRRILETARRLGFPLKIHADEFDNLGGASLAAELGAASADHLVDHQRADIAALAASDTVAVPALHTFWPGRRPLLPPPARSWKPAACWPSPPT